MSTAGAGHTGRFARPHDVVWRLAPDRVLVRRVGDLGDDGCADLIGPAAVVWAALDEPASADELRTRLADAGIEPTDTEFDDYGEALHALVERHWLDPIDDAGVETGTAPGPQRDRRPRSAGASHER